uniref:Gypsy retrotransposon integrase-like protein 1 n=1 Tax=Nothobranchius furzeri TaxID=105023 RepID=A0A8C6KJ83_NOTFU
MGLPLSDTDTVRLYEEILSLSNTLATLIRLKLGTADVCTSKSARSNQSFKDLLMEELAKIGESLGRDTHASEPVTEPEPMLHSDQVTYSLPLTPEVNYMNNSKDNCPPTETGKQNPCIPPNLLNTPEVQRVIVEHIEHTTSLLLVLPDSLRSTVMQSLHDDMGHLGVERMTDLIRSRFYWPKMASDIKVKVKTCERCIHRKALPDKAAPMVSITTNRPMELVCMDFLSIEPDSKNTKDVLVITDHFTKYAVSIPTKDQKAITVAKNLWEHFLVHYGFPERLHSDQGWDFELRTIKELCSLLGIRKVRTSPYHPRGNPVERYNRTLLSMLGTLQATEKHHWRDFVKPLTHSYNCTKNDVTGYSPYELMFGRQPRLPIDITFELPHLNKPSITHSQYVKELKSHLEQSYDIVIKNSQKQRGRTKNGSTETFVSPH